MSLVVGGVGIVNIMLVAVTERRREIGVRIAIGARPRDIGAQFLAEAATLGIIGGVAGIAAGIGAAHGLAFLAGWPMIVSPEVIALSAAVSVVTGVFFGSFPAYRASRLDPIEALRKE